MQWQFTPYVVPTAVSTLLSFGLFAYIVSLRRRDLDQPVVRAFVVLAFAIALWGFGDVVQFSSTTLAAKRASLAVQFVGAAAATLSLLAFAFAYTDHEKWIRPAVFGPLVGETLVALGLLLTSPQHHQLYVTAVDTQTVGGIVQLERTLGPAATVHIAISYASVVLGIALLVRAALRSESVFRSQSIAVITGVTLPLLINVVWFVGEGQQNNVDLTVVGFGLAVFPLWYAVSQHDLLGISPVARDGVIENMRDAVVVVDRHDQIVDANPAVTALGVTDPSDLVAVVATDAFPFLEPALDANAETPDEVAVDTDDGTRFFDVSVQALDGVGQGRRLVLLRDVTEQRRIEERYQRLIEHSSDMITVLDADARIKYDSPAVETLLGYDQDEWLGHRGRERVHPDDRERVVGEFEKGVQEPGYTTRLEYRIEHADGSYRVFETFASNLLHDPIVEGVVLNSRDVTDRKRRERELERTNERLDEFASVVSHDLRNPLTVGNGYLELAKMGDEDALAEVEVSHDRMERIIDDALALAREEETVDGIATVDLDAIAHSAWGSVETHNATLVADTGATLAADASRLQRLFENLFRNTVEHGSTSNRTRSDDTVEHGSPSSRTASGNTVEHGPTSTQTTTDEAVEHAVERSGTDLTVTVTADRNDDGELVGFSVADDGVGIPERERVRVFESGVTSREDGTGFGLAIVETIANAHGWRISVGESERGGARFDVTLDAGHRTDHDDAPKPG